MSIDLLLTRVRSRIRSWVGPTSAGPDGIVLATNCYGSYAIPVTALHRRPVRIVLRGGVYEPRTIEFVRNRCGDGDVVHAGAFFGDFLPGYASALAPGAVLWVFEPNPLSFACARRTAALNGLGNVAFENAAISDRPGELLLRTRDLCGRALGGAARLVPGESSRRRGATVVVPAVTVDQVVPVARRVGIVQLDLEGHEKAALVGARRTIERNRPILILEDFDDADWLDELFPGIGYRHAGYLHRNAVYLPAR